jgi:hypothetical protein
VAWHPIGDVAVFKHHDLGAVFFAVATSPFHIEIVGTQNVLLDGLATANGEAGKKNNYLEFHARKVVESLI